MAWSQFLSRAFSNGIIWDHGLLRLTVCSSWYARRSAQQGICIISVPVFSVGVLPLFAPQGSVTAKLLLAQVRRQMQEMSNRVQSWHASVSLISNLLNSMFLKKQSARIGEVRELGNGTEYFCYVEPMNENSCTSDGRTRSRCMHAKSNEEA